MTKSCKTYIHVWACAAALVYAVIAGFARESVAVRESDDGFTAVCALTVFSLLCQLLIARRAFRGSDETRYIFGFSQSSVAFFSLAFTTLSAVLFMSLPDISVWVALVLYLLLCALCAVSALKAKPSANDGEAERAQLKKAALIKTVKKVALFAIPAAAVCAALAFLLINKVVIPNNYQKASELMRQEDYKGAFAVFTTLDYEDSAALAKQCEGIIEQQRYASQTSAGQQTGVGSTVAFGGYEQDGDVSNGKEDVEWLVLERKDNMALLLSERCLDCLPYYERDADKDWEKSTLYVWLNSDFLDAALVPQAREAVCAVGANKVFLLDSSQTVEYFVSDSRRQAAATPYARAHGASGFGSGSDWWLSGYNYVGSDGGIRIESGVYYSIAYKHIAVRPAMWIDTDKLPNWS